MGICLVMHSPLNSVLHSVVTASDLLHVVYMLAQACNIRPTFEISTKGLASSQSSAEFQGESCQAKVL